MEAREPRAAAKKELLQSLKIRHRTQSNDSSVDGACVVTSGTDRSDSSHHKRRRKSSKGRSISPSGLSIASSASSTGRQSGISSKQACSIAECVVKACPSTEFSLKADGRTKIALFDPPANSKNIVNWALYVPEVNNLTTPNKHKVCELHFVEGRPTKQNPFPTQNLYTLPPCSKQYKGSVSNWGVKAKNIITTPPIVIKNTGEGTAKGKKIRKVDCLASCEVESLNSVILPPYNSNDASPSVAPVSTSHDQFSERNYEIGWDPKEPGSNRNGRFSNELRTSFSETEYFDDCQQLQDILKNTSHKGGSRPSSANSNRRKSSGDGTLKIKLPAHNKAARKSSASPPPQKKMKFFAKKISYSSPVCKSAEKTAVDSENLIRLKATAEFMKSPSIASKTIASSMNNNGGAVQQSSLPLIPDSSNGIEQNNDFSGDVQRFDSYDVDGTEAFESCRPEFRELRKDLYRVENKIDTLTAIVRSFLMEANSSTPGQRRQPIKKLRDVICQTPNVLLKMAQKSEINECTGDCSAKRARKITTVITKVVGGSKMQGAYPDSLQQDNAESAVTASVIVGPVASMQNTNFLDTSTSKEGIARKMPEIVDESAAVVEKNSIGTSAAKQTFNGMPQAVESTVNFLPSWEKNQTEGNDDDVICIDDSPELAVQGNGKLSSNNTLEAHTSISSLLESQLIHTSVLKDPEAPAKVHKPIDEPPANFNSKKKRNSSKMPANDPVTSVPAVGNDGCENATASGSFRGENSGGLVTDRKSSTEVVTRKQNPPEKNSTREKKKTASGPRRKSSLDLLIDEVVTIKNASTNGNIGNAKFSNARKNGTTRGRIDTDDVAFAETPLYVNEFAENVTPEDGGESNSVNRVGNFNDADTAAETDSLSQDGNVGLAEEAVRNSQQRNPIVVVQKYNPAEPKNEVNHAVARAILLFGGRGVSVDHVKEYGPSWLSGITRKEIKVAMEHLASQGLLIELGTHHVSWIANKGKKVLMCVYSKKPPEEINARLLRYYGIDKRAYVSSYTFAPSKHTVSLNEICSGADY